MLACDHIAFVDEVPEGEAICRRCDRTEKLVRLADEDDARAQLATGSLVSAADIYLICRRRGRETPNKKKEPRRNAGRKRQPQQPTTGGQRGFGI